MKRLENWSVYPYGYEGRFGISGDVYGDITRPDGRRISTSEVRRFASFEVTTVSGSLYKLGEALDPSQVKVLRKAWKRRVKIMHPAKVLSVAVTSPDFRSLLKPRGDNPPEGYTMGYVMNKAINFPGVGMLSVQGHSGSYCDPRTYCASAYEYRSMEIAFITDASGLTAPPEGTPHANRWEQCGSPVAGYMEIAEIQDVFNFLYRLAGNRATVD